jgi:hypothetical protein
MRKWMKAHAGVKREDEKGEKSFGTRGRGCHKLRHKTTTESHDWLAGEGDPHRSASLSIIQPHCGAFAPSSKRDQFEA